MSATLTLHRPGPGTSVQDLGRPGQLGLGLSQGGAADRLALIEAAALLNLPASAVLPATEEQGGLAQGNLAQGNLAPTEVSRGTQIAAIEMPMMGAGVTVSAPMRIALTGAQMSAQLNHQPIAWNATHLVTPGDHLSIGAARTGCYGYLTPAGGLLTPRIMSSRASHFAAGIGAALTDGDGLPVGDDPAPAAPPMRLIPDDRLSGGTLRVMPGPQSDLFDTMTSQRFFATPFTRSAIGNRQGVRLDHDGAPFAMRSLPDGHSLASDLIVPGDIQMTGDGIPYVLMSECQTMGGYARIGTIVPADLGRLAQASPGTPLMFTRVSLQQGDASWQSDTTSLAQLKSRVHPLRRDPHDIADLLAYQLIGGVTRGDDI